jgi:hypothetical protein
VATRVNSLRWTRAVRWPFGGQRWIWLLPLALYAFVRREQARLHTGIEAVVGLCFVALVAKRPYKALNWFVVFLPFGLLTLSFLYRIHVPGQVVRGLGFWKEGVVAGLAVAAVTRSRRYPSRWDWLDRIALGYVALGLVYLIGQPFFVGNAVGAHLSFYARELGWRSDILYVGLFVVCRHLGLERRQLEAVIRRVLIVSLIMALVGIYEFIRPYSFNHFVTATLRLGR